MMESGDAQAWKRGKGLVYKIPEFTTFLKAVQLHVCASQRPE